MSYQQPPNWQPQQPYQPQQPQYQQPPETPYQQPQQPFYPQQPPKKKSKTWLWIVLAVVAVLVLGCIGFSVITSNAAKTVTNTVATTVATTAATTTNTQPQSSNGTWKTTHTFTGNGTKKTVIFSVGSDWKIVYSCNGMIAGTATDGVLSVSIYGSDASILDPAAVNATCKSGSALTKGETEEHQSGSVYLDINGTGDWTVQVQELK